MFLFFENNSFLFKKILKISQRISPSIAKLKSKNRKFLFRIVYCFKIHIDKHIQKKTNTNICQFGGFWLLATSVYLFLADIFIHRIFNALFGKNGYKNVFKIRYPTLLKKTKKNDSNNTVFYRQKKKTWKNLLVYIFFSKLNFNNL